MSDYHEVVWALEAKYGSVAKIRVGKPMFNPMVDPQPLYGNITVKFLPNGYEASICHGGFGYSNAEYTEFELAVLGPDGQIDYTTPVTDDVLAYVPFSHVLGALETLKDMSNG